MQTVQRANASVQHFVFASSSPLRRPEELAATADTESTSGFHPLKPSMALLVTPSKNVVRAANLHTISVSQSTQPGSGADAPLDDDERWCTARDWYTQDDDNRGWF